MPNPKKDFLGTKDIPLKEQYYRLNKMIIGGQLDQAGRELDHLFENTTYRDHPAYQGLAISLLFHKNKYQDVMTIGAVLFEAHPYLKEVGFCLATAYLRQRFYDKAIHVAETCFQHNDRSNKLPQILFFAHLEKEKRLRIEANGNPGMMEAAETHHRQAIEAGIKAVDNFRVHGGYRGVMAPEQRENFKNGRFFSQFKGLYPQAETLLFFPMPFASSTSPER